MNISRIYERETAEVGKGCVDSIVIPYDTTIMSEYTNGIIMVEKSRIIPSGMIVVEGTPVAFNIDKESRETSSLNTSKVKKLVLNIKIVFFNIYDTKIHI
ncbi:MAG: hypothetical protein L6V81_04460 [Clostridium sp.]|nr:MAG: hypothetical protein L6V81_04460 [Clostridium sp.]